jgi:hypothetical protein
VLDCSATILMRRGIASPEMFLNAVPIQIVALQTTIHDRHQPAPGRQMAPTPSSTASSTTPTVSISPETACAGSAKSPPKKIDHSQRAVPQLQQPARHTLWATSESMGGIIPECPGGFVGIRTVAVAARDRRSNHRAIIRTRCSMKQSPCRAACGCGSAKSSCRSARPWRQRFG